MQLTPSQILFRLIEVELICRKVIYQNESDLGSVERERGPDDVSVRPAGQGRDQLDQSIVHLIRFLIFIIHVIAFLLNFNIVSNLHRGDSRLTSRFFRNKKKRYRSYDPKQVLFIGIEINKINTKYGSFNVINVNHNPQLIQSRKKNPDWENDVRFCRSLLLIQIPPHHTKTRGKPRGSCPANQFQYLYVL